MYKANYNPFAGEFSPETISLKSSSDYFGLDEPRLDWDPFESPRALAKGIAFFFLDNPNSVSPFPLRTRRAGWMEDIIFCGSFDPGPRLTLYDCVSFRRRFTKTNMMIRFLKGGDYVWEPELEINCSAFFDSSITANAVILYDVGSLIHHPIKRPSCLESKGSPLNNPSDEDLHCPHPRFVMPRRDINSMLQDWGTIQCFQNICRTISNIAIEVGNKAIEAGFSATSLE